MILRRQLDVRQRVQRATRRTRRVHFDAKQEIGADKNLLEGELDAADEAPAAAAFLVEPEHGLKIVGCERTTVRAATNIGQDCPGACVLSSEARFGRREDAAHARRLAGAVGRVGALDRHALDRRVAVEHLVGRERPARLRRLHDVVGLPCLLHERDAQCTDAGLHREPQLEPIVGPERVELPLRASIHGSRPARRCLAVRVLPSDCEASDARAIQAYLELMRFGQTANVVIQVRAELNPDRVLSANGEVVPNDRAAARAERQLLAQSLVLRRELRHIVDVDRRPSARAERRAGNLVGSRQISLEQQR
jgi:hypothetical protein